MHARRFTRYTARDPGRCPPAEVRTSIRTLGDPLTHEQPALQPLAPLVPLMPTALRRPVVMQWTGREASALRLALRMTTEEYADHLGVAARTVTKWNTNPGRVVVPEIQRVLDTVLDRAPAQAWARFTFGLIATGRHVASQDGPQTAALLAGLGAQLAELAARLDQTDARLAALSPTLTGQGSSPAARDVLRPYATRHQGAPGAVLPHPGQGRARTPETGSRRGGHTPVGQEQVRNPGQ